VTDVFNYSIAYNISLSLKCNIKSTSVNKYHALFFEKKYLQRYIPLLYSIFNLSVILNLLYSGDSNAIKRKCGGSMVEDVVSD
jgi:hypothetical protein